MDLSNSQTKLYVPHGFGVPRVQIFLAEYAEANWTELRDHTFNMTITSREVLKPSCGLVISDIGPEGNVQRNILLSLMTLKIDGIWIKSEILRTPNKIPGGRSENSSD